MQPPTSTTDYAQQLARGFRWLRFAPPLEAEYRAQRDASLRAFLSARFLRFLSHLLSRGHIGGLLSLHQALDGRPGCGIDG